MHRTAQEAPLLWRHHDDSREWRVSELNNTRIASRVTIFRRPAPGQTARPESCCVQMTSATSAPLEWHCSSELASTVRIRPRTPETTALLLRKRLPRCILPTRTLQHPGSISGRRSGLSRTCKSTRYTGELRCSALPRVAPCYGAAVAEDQQADGAFVLETHSNGGKDRKSGRRGIRGEGRPQEVFQDAAGLSEGSSFANCAATHRSR
eukprot:scaffold1740_cov254-Pinguiococcus_pyrenoidosus.AAC.8